MKTKFKNNFTTEEQSKRLLELGVPADSADCCVENTWDGLMIYVFGGCETYSTIDEDEHPNIQYPCWSVGRLMEIFDICFPESDTACWPPFYELDTDYITYIVRLYERGIMELDFSKLEV